MKRSVCQWEGCTTQRGILTQFCAKHVTVAKQCRFDNCEARIAAWNYYELCKEHRWLSKK